MNSRDRMLAACRNRPTDRPPVWLMRQAGRYLPEYRELRSRHSFREMLRTPELAVEVTLQPVRRFGMDAAILFSDILVVLDAMGVDVRYVDGPDGGLEIAPVVRQESDLARLRVCRPEEEFGFISQAVCLLARRLHPSTAVIGFAGAPLTLAAYLIEGGKVGELKHLKLMAYGRPALYHEIMSRITDLVTELLALQVRSGADLVWLFDTWSLHLSAEDYLRLALPYVRTVFDRLRPLDVPMGLYTRNSSGLLEEAAGSGCTVVSLDPSLLLPEARARVGSRVALAGNLDPIELHGPEERIRARVIASMDAMAGTGYVVNVGRGLPPDTPVEGVATLVETVKEWRR